MKFQLYEFIFKIFYLDKIRQSLLILEEFRGHLLLFSIKLINNSDDALAAEMFGVGDFWLEIRLIINILSHP